MPKQSETCPHGTRAAANEHPSGSLQREQRAAQVCQKDTHLTGGLAAHAGQPQKSQNSDAARRDDARCLPIPLTC